MPDIVAFLPYFQPFGTATTMVGPEAVRYYECAASRSQHVILRLLAVCRREVVGLPECGLVWHQVNRCDNVGWRPRPILSDLWSSR
jgi:hypothetical protein